jgi:hypothetical protein
VLSIIAGGGKWVVDPLYLSVLVSAEKKFWRCVQARARSSTSKFHVATSSRQRDRNRPD